MRFVKNYAVAMSFALVTASAGTASAAIMTATYSGTIRSGTDTTGDFGVAGADLFGQHFELSFVYDTELGSRLTMPGYLDYVDGSISSATLDIGGLKQTITGGFSSSAHLVDVGDLGVMELASHSKYENYTFNNIFHNSSMTVNIYTDIINTSLENDYVAGKSATIYGEFGAGMIELHEIDYNTNTTVHDLSLGLKPDTLRISAAVPEPSTWALMVGGFGFAGAAIRRQRRVRAAA